MQDRFEMSVKRLGLEDPQALGAAQPASREAEADSDLLVKSPSA